MWTIATSDGRRVANLRSEIDARRIVQTLGITQLSNDQNLWMSLGEAA